MLLVVGRVFRAKPVLIHFFDFRQRENAVDVILRAAVRRVNRVVNDLKQLDFKPREHAFMLPENTCGIKGLGV